MTINYPGRSADEIMSLAVDIVECAPNKQYHDYVVNCMIPAAEDCMDEYGDYFCEFSGYHMSTVVYCARRIADELEEKGYIVP